MGYEYDDPPAGSGNSRNGHSTKTVSTTTGPVTIRVPRDRNGEFEPQIVPKRARRVGQVDELVLSCYARGMSTRDIEAHLWEVYGVTASRELISNITDMITDEIETWRNRPVDEVYPIMWAARYVPETSDELGRLPAVERAAVLNAVEKLQALGEQLGFPPTSAVKGAVV